MLKSGHKVFASSLKEYEKIYEDFERYRVGTVRLQPDNWFLTLPFINFADKIHDFKLKPTDVFILTFPKSGTAWMQEIVSTILRNPNLDDPKASEYLNTKCPFLEFDFLMRGHGYPLQKPGEVFYDLLRSKHPDRDPEEGIFIQLAELSEEPRIIKSHLPLSLLPPSLLDTCKVIYLTRNPLDLTVSYHHHCEVVKSISFIGSLDSFVDHMVNDSLLYSPYWTHLKESWSKRNHPNMLFTYYEDMKTNPKKEIERTAKFLNVPLTETQIDNIVSYTSFKAMKDRHESDLKPEVVKSRFNKDVFEADGGFFRKGETSDWKNKLSNEHIKKLSEWSKEKSKDFDDDFKYKMV